MFVGHRSTRAIISTLTFVLVAASGLAETQAAPNKPRASSNTFPWMRVAPPIAGTWQLAQAPGCQALAGMVVTIVTADSQPTVATGTVTKLSANNILGYRKGEVVMKLRANDFGLWPAKILWRSILGVQRWDPGTFSVQGQTIEGKMLVDRCWSRLTRAR
jgi:hypothetical protein